MTLGDEHRLIGGHSSETSSHPIDVNMNMNNSSAVDNEGIIPHLQRLTTPRFLGLHQKPLLMIAHFALEILWNHVHDVYYKVGCGNLH
jgi:hypothetical protein